MSKIQGFGGGGKSGGGGVEASDTLRSIQYAVFIDAISEGPIRGLANGMQSVYFNEVPLQNPDNSFNFVGAFDGGATSSGTSTTTAVSTTYYATSNGDLNGSAVSSALAGIPGMNGAEYESNVSVPITNALPHIERITASNVDHVRITIGFESGLTAADSSGNINGTSVHIAIDLQTNGGGYVQMIDDTVSGKSSSKYQRSYLIPLTGAGPFDVRVRRVSGDTTSSLIADKFTWETYTGIISTQLAYPHTAWAAFRIDASQFSGIPTRGYDIYGLIIQVPTNYDPIARTYSGTWDGTFKLAWSNNPAWVFYDMATNSRYGLGDYLGASATDKWRLYTIAQYCDAMVSDGAGGTEPRFVCNLYIQGQQDAYKVMMDLASVFNSITYWGGGELLVSQDAPADVVSIFTNANVIDGQFSYQGTSIKARHTVALVGWNDPADFCKQKIEYVQDDDGVRKYGVIKSDVKAFGCTSRGQAHRFGRSILFTEKYETEVCTFKCGMDGAYVFPGAIIQTSDLTRAGKRMGGRIVSATSTSAVLDAAFAPVGGMSYSLIIIGADGSVMTAGISSFSGTTVALSQSLAVQALAGAVFIISESDIQPEMWRVVEVAESAPNELTVSCVTHNPGKYATIENGAPLAVIPTSNIRATPGVVSNIKLSPGAAFTDSGVSCLLSWDAAPNATSYKVTWAAANGLSQSQTAYSTSLDVAYLLAGVDYTFSITAISSAGVPSYPVYFAQAASSPPPPLAPTATATGGLFCVRLAWTFGDSAGGRTGTEIWWSATNNLTVASRLSVEPFPGQEYTHVGLSAGQGGYYWLRVGDTYRNFSAWYPSGPTAGISASSSTDASALLAQMNGAIGATQLRSELASAIAEIPTLSSGIGAAVITSTSNALAISSLVTAFGDSLASVSAQATNNDAKVVLRAQANGSMAAFALGSSATSGTSALFSVDKFAITKSDGTGAAAVFEVDSVTGNVGVNGNLLVNGTVSGEALTATSRITAGTGSNVAIIDGSDANYRVWAGHADPALAPFSVSKTGDVKIQAVSGSASVQISNSVIKVYDTSGVLRVKLGDLSL